MLTHDIVAKHAVATCAEMRVDGTDVWAHVAPMFHLVDAFAIYSVTMVGGRHVILPAFEAGAVLRLIEREGVTITNMVGRLRFNTS
jgi:acyl-CoA synthetase (AMP-forming)/AMP-acid ligase II